MSTEFFNDQWRIPSNENQNKVSNYSMKFDGTNDVINCGLNAPFNAASTKFSISLWCKSPNSFTDSGNLVESRLSYADPDGIAIEFISNSMYFRKSGSTVGKTITQWGLNNSNWNHIVYVYDLTLTGNKIFVYINGTLLSSTPQAATSQPASTGDFRIGDGLRGNFNGSIDQVNVFDYALSASQVSTLRGGGAAVTNPMSLSPKPIAYYQLGDQSVSTGPTSDYLVPNNSLQDYVFNFIPNDYIDLGNVTALNSQSAFSTSAWINYSGTPSTSGYMFLSGGSAGSNRFFIQLASSSKIRYIIGGTTKDTVITSINSGDWHNIVTVHNGTSLDIYLDGVKQTGSPFTVPVPNTNIGQQFKIGSYFTGAFNWNGKLSNTAIWNTALTDSQVQTIYNNGKPGDISSLDPTGWWKLNASEIFNNTSTEWSVDNNAYPSVYKSSLNFDGNDYIDTNRTLASNLDFSISAWINPTSDDTVIVGTRGLASASVSNGVTMNINASGNLWGRIFTETSNITQVQTGSVISLNSWSHVAMTYDSSTKTLKTYLNGSEAGSIVGTDSSVASTADLSVGRASIGTVYDYFDGEISNVSIFNTELTSTQVQTIYNNGTPETLISHSPTSWYKLDNTTTGVQDSSGSNNGTNNGTTEYAGFVNALAGESSNMDSSNLVVSDLQQTNGYSPYALDFDGVDNYLDCGTNPFDETTGDITLSAWVKKTSGTGYRPIVAATQGGVGTSTYFSFQFSGTNSLSIFWDGVGGSDLYVVPSSEFTVVNGNWYLINFVRTGTVGTIYVNGNLVSTSTKTYNNFSFADRPNITLGGWNFSTSARLNGELSNVSLWNAALTSAQITEVYNEGVPSNLNNHSAYSNLISWWQLGSNSSFNTDWTVLNEISTGLNGVSQNMTNDEIVNGPGYSAMGLGTSSIDIKGDAPYSTANGLSENMDVLDRVKDTPPS